MQFQPRYMEIIRFSYGVGGPFIKENGRGDADDVLVGLLSGGSGCGVNGSPAIYSRVSSAVPWINTAMKTK
ncbi:hypothetical protein PHYSODRAFT_341747 [Phytophthora sojae]|uniref:Peptidase S1 domain-containing protein n=1 Tax=Phytophthora sojae (strain P6497) TaxID=1094619 RepID=G5AE87_PHYSP|nr:hypothetical protein PHYSODRAFT_341747 [Phytophthora sojae]EGZ06489.1 hypothetical protein PHYSODRAFT_341747 [Phytophthora sojae]|eukprot:XP_009538386.1 hypothetical protein PHYSODRAFT_341747 [Phytophthora sojae]